MTSRMRETGVGRAVGAAGGGGVWGGGVGLPRLEVAGVGISPGEFHDLADARDGHGACDRGGGRGPVAGSGSGLAGAQWASSFACLPCSLGHVVDKSVAVDDPACV